MGRPLDAHCPAVDFQTPPEAVEPILPYISRSWCVWEPAAGKGNIVNALRRNGNNTLGSDIKGQVWEEIDFLNPEDSAWMAEFIDAIVTNPPYTRGDMDGFIVRCFEIGKPFALLVPLTALEGARKRIPAYVEAKPRVQVIVMGRVRFTTPTGLQGMDSNPTFGVCWLTWKLELPNDLCWWHNGELR